MNILLGVTGGIAAYKALELVSLLRRQGHEVRVTMTDAACRLVSPAAFRTLSGNHVASDLFEEDVPQEVRHIAWAEWADRAVLAPATANTIAKLAGGVADNMLTTIFLATEAPLYVAPAMNMHMLAKPAVQGNLRRLREWGAHIIEPAAGRLACGDVGPGRLPEPEVIAACVTRPHGPLAGRRVLVTAGPTSEPIDPVRAITNRSSGRMGYALAQAALAAGAEVCLISGPVQIEPPPGAQIIRVRTAQEMYDAVMEQAGGQDVIIACAAVSDYRPVAAAAQKIKKTEEKLTLELERTKDILADLGRHKNCYLVGFAAETENLLAAAGRKLREKNLDMIVANDVSGDATGFDSADNAVTVMTRTGVEEAIPRSRKTEIAERLIALITGELAQRS